MSRDFDELLKIQRNIASRLVDENKVDRKIELYELARNLSTTNDFQVEQLALLASEYGFSEEELYELIDELEEDGYIAKTSKGYKIIF